MSRVQDAATAWAFAAGWRLVKRLPESAARRAFQMAADRTWSRRGEGVQQLERNLRRVRPNLSEEQIRELSREGMRAYLRYYCEAFRLPAYSPAQLRDSFVLDGVEMLDEAVRTKRGIIVVSAHTGNWDLAGAWAAQRYGSVTSVAERLKPERVFDEFVAFRTSMGVDIHGTGEAHLVATLARAARQGKVVALVGDRDFSRSGVEVSFFGEPAPFPTGPVVLSLLSGSPLHPIFTWYDGDIMRGELRPAIEVPQGLPRDEQIRRMTQAMADELAVGIDAHPADWHMLQRLWAADSRPR